MKELIMLKYGEIILKGQNRYRFEDTLLRLARNRMKKIGNFDVWSMQSTVYVEPVGEQDMDRAEEAALKILGFQGGCLPKGYRGDKKDGMGVS